MRRCGACASGQLASYQIVVDDGLLPVGEVEQPGEDRDDNRARFALGQHPSGRSLQMAIEIATGAVLQHGGKCVCIHLKDVAQLANVRMLHGLVYVILAHGVPHVGGLALLGPVGIELVDLHRDVAKAREIVRLENLRKAPLAEQPVQHVPRARRVRTEGVPKASQPARILVALPAQLTNVRDFLCL